MPANHPAADAPEGLPGAAASAGLPAAVASPGLPPAVMLAGIPALYEELAEAEALPGAINHELRSPLSAILVLTTLLRKRGAGPVDGEALDLLEHLAASARETVDILDGLARFAQVRTQPMAPRAIDLRAEVRIAFEAAVLRHGGAPPALAFGELPRPCADLALMRLVLAELLGNAVRCTAGRPAPCIEVGGRTLAGGTEFFVRDNGIGFDAHHAERLFKPFGRLHPQPDPPGIGLGLAIVRRIVRRHGGRVRAEGEPGRGATFHVALPASPHQASSATLTAE